MDTLTALLSRRTTWALLLVVAAIVLAGWATLPLLPAAGRVLALAYLALVLAGLALRGTVYTVWVAGVLTVLTPVALVLLATVFVTGDARTGLRGLVYLYVAGTLGGLVLELLQQKRYVLEKPTLVKQAQAGRRPAVRDASVVRDGPMWHLGFLSRMFMGGLAGAALVTLIGSVLGDLTVGNATGPTALIWALVAGSTAPAVWKLLDDMVLKRGNAVDEVLAGLEQHATLNAPQNAPQNPAQQGGANNGQANGQVPSSPDLTVTMARALRRLV